MFKTIFLEMLESVYVKNSFLENYKELLKLRIEKSRLSSEIQKFFLMTVHPTIHLPSILPLPSLHLCISRLCNGRRRDGNGKWGDSNDRMDGRWTVANSFKTARSRKQDGNGNGTAMVTCQKQKIYCKYINDSQPFGRKWYLINSV